MTRLHIFDLDGTLLHGTSAPLEIARVTGTGPRLTELEHRFSAGELDSRGFAAELFSLWGHLTEEHVDEAFAGSPFLEGIAEVCADIRKRGERSLVITLSPGFYARRLHAFGFDEIVASDFPDPPFPGPPDPERILRPQDKVRIAEEARAAAGIPLEMCTAYGDSLSDAPLFGHVGGSVSVNGDHHVAALATAAYTGRSLPEAYALGRSLAA
ncbi:HAD-IB family phosphatase [Nocardiopsis sp. CNT-189]|uniref:HAD family hydrolase n=1 Tax=Nocardiopsis oceanisediminis TaxID=2816862 RepID=UPI003B365381